MTQPMATQRITFFHEKYLDNNPFLLSSLFLKYLVNYKNVINETLFCKDRFKIKLLIIIYDELSMVSLAEQGHY